VILDLFAGPGGWDTGLRALGHDTAGGLVGIEQNRAACATASAAGHARTRADVWSLTYHPGQFTGIIASPPCPGFSSGGKHLGRSDAPALIDAAAQMHADEDPRDALFLTVQDARSLFALEPLRAVLAVRPDVLGAGPRRPAVVGGVRFRAPRPRVRRGGGPGECGAVRGAAGPSAGHPAGCA
jgi:DNA (cytosine-5)-methyltransferase 1